MPEWKLDNEKVFWQSFSDSWLMNDMTRWQLHRSDYLKQS
jgi:hypothetical protein